MGLVKSLSIRMLLLIADNRLICKVMYGILCEYVPVTYQVQSLDVPICHFLSCLWWIRGHLSKKGCTLWLVRGFLLAFIIIVILVDVSDSLSLECRSPSIKYSSYSIALFTDSLPFMLCLWQILFSSSFCPGFMLTYSWGEWLMFLILLLKVPGAVVAIFWHFSGLSWHKAAT